MNKFTNSQYVEIFYKLPPEIKDVVASSETTNHLWKIGQKHSLQIDQIGVMTDIAFDVMMGIIASKNFVAEIQKELSISPIDASILARDIDENVFRPIKSSMIALYGDKAPNKPSSSLVQITEEEDNHMNLDKDLLLKEIESPVIAKPRIILSQPTEIKIAVPEVKVEHKEVKVEVKEPSPVTAIEEYHEEIALGDKIESKAVEKEPTTTQPETKSTLGSLDRLAEMKLSKAMVMPKRDMFESKVEVPEAKAVAPEAPSNTPSEASSPKQEVKQYATDPYREPIN